MICDGVGNGVCYSSEDSWRTYASAKVNFVMRLSTA